MKMSKKFSVLMLNICALVGAYGGLSLLTPSIDTTWKTFYGGLMTVTALVGGLIASRLWVEWWREYND